VAAACASHPGRPPGTAPRDESKRAEHLARAQSAANLKGYVDTHRPAIALALARGDRDAAVDRLRLAAEPGTSGMLVILETSARYALGVLLGGDEGRELRGWAAAILRAGGATAVDQSAWQWVCWFHPEQVGLKLP